MSVSKRVAYLKGLAEGLELDSETKEGKLISVMIDILEDITLEIEEIQEDITALDDDIGSLDDDLEDLEDIIFAGLREEDDEDDYDLEDGEPIFYEVKCPSCGHEITIDEDILLLGSIECPSCSEKLELDLDELEDEEECDCGHEH